MDRQVIRCSDGHLYTAEWLPGFSWRSLRLGGGRRYDHCPVDRRWRVAQIVDPAGLTEQELAQARQHDGGVR